jgi:hypothetical protein
MYTRSKTMPIAFLHRARTDTRYMLEQTTVTHTIFSHLSLPGDSRKSFQKAKVEALDRRS